MADDSLSVGTLYKNTNAEPTNIAASEPIKMTSLLLDELSSSSDNGSPKYQPPYSNNIEKDEKMVKDDDEEKSFDAVPYSIITHGERYIFILVLSLIGFWSATSSPIYFPALPTLSLHFKVSEEVMNLSVVAYLILQGISPTISSNLADTYGRRPVYMASLLGYTATCIALSQTNAFWLLTVLRCLQAAAIAPVVAINSGVSADVCTPAERGGFVGVVGGTLLVGNGFGGLIGAALVSRWSWRAIFIFLAIGGGSTLIMMLCLLPETGRLIVGNASIKPKNPIHVAPVLYLPYINRRLTNQYQTLKEQPKLDILAPFRILVRLTVIASLIPAGLLFSAWTMTLTSISTVLESDAYNYSVMHVGLIYLPQGIACLVGSFAAGWALDTYYKYRRDAYDTKYQDTIDKPAFNKVRVRIDVCIIPACLQIIGLVIFGWCLEYKRHIISIIISTCLIAASSSAFIAAVTTMLVDLFPAHSSASSSCMNLVRCLLAAVGVAVLEKMTNALSLGGTYTLLAGLCLVSDFLIVFVAWNSTKQLNT